MLGMIIEELYDNFILLRNSEDEVKSRLKKSMIEYYEKFATFNSMKECSQLKQRLLKITDGNEENIFKYYFIMINAFRYILFLESSIRTQK